MKAAADVTLGPAHQQAADTFVMAGALEKKYKKDREAAKKVLVDGLGKSRDGTLPDGRTVSKVIAHFEETTFSRAAYDSTTITISTLSTSDVQGELSKLAKPAAQKITLPRDGGGPKAKAAASASPKARVGK
jgi:hypothetical protein